jgi:predicted site-specific integrase-resolvase
MANETKFNIVQAAELAGVTRQTIHRFIKKGKLSVEKTVDGKTVIDKSELLRVFPNLVTPGASHVLRLDTPQVTATLHSQIELLQRELDVTRQERERDREECRREKDRLLGIIEKQTLLLPAPKEPEEKKGWLRRWFT